MWLHDNLKDFKERESLAEAVSLCIGAKFPYKCLFQLFFNSSKSLLTRHSVASSLHGKLDGKEISVQDIESSERLFFDAVVSDDKIDAQKLGFVSAAAASADAAEETPNQSLSLLADCIATSVTRKAVAGRLASALSHIERCEAFRGSACPNLIPEPSTTESFLDRAMKVSRARLVLERLTLVSVEERKKRLQKLICSGSARELELTCDILAHEDSAENKAAQAVSHEIIAMLLGLERKRLIEEIWGLSINTLARMCANHFPFFQAYIKFLLCRLRIVLWRMWLSNVNVVEVAEKARRSGIESGDLARFHLVEGRKDLRKLADADCAEARELTGTMDEGRSSEEVLGEIDRSVGFLCKYSS